MAPRRLVLALMAAFGALALLLAGIGLYGVLAFSVARRTPELGIRAALGATRASLLALVLTRGLALIAAGLVTGALLAAATTGVLGSLLFGVSAVDAPPFAASAGVILVACVAACAIPARRAARVDPLTAIRSA